MKEERKEQERQLISRIEQLGYLKDENKLQNYINNRKEKLKNYIITVQNSSIDELCQDKLKALEEEYIEEMKNFREDVLPKIKFARRNTKRHQKKDNAIIHLDNCNITFTASQLYTMTDDELVEEALKQQDAIYVSEKKKVYDSAVRLKDKYDGVTMDEIDSYVDLSVNKDILIDTKELEIAELTLDAIHKKDFGLTDTLEEYSIQQIEELDDTLKAEKESRKKDLFEVAKTVSIFGVGASVVTAAAATALIPSSPLVIFVSSLIAGTAIVTPAMVGLVCALTGVHQLLALLQEKKFVKKLKESGIYDLVVEKAYLEKEKFELFDKNTKRR